MTADNCPLVSSDRGNRKNELLTPGSIHFNKTRMHSCRISSKRKLYHYVTFNFVIHFVKQKAIPLFFICVCHRFHQAEGYATLLCLSSAYISSSRRLYLSFLFAFVIDSIKQKAMPLYYV